MKILVVDYLCQKGHKNYIDILLRSLESLDLEITFITSRDYMDYLDVKLQRLNKIEYKAQSFKSRNTLYNILYQIFSLKKVEWKIRKKKFDYIIFASYNIYSYFFFRRKEPIYIINHDNIDRLVQGNVCALNLHKHLGLNSRYIVLSPYIKANLEKILPSKNILYIPHGIIQNLSKGSGSHFSQYQNIIFCSARSSCNIDFLYNLLSDESNQRFLEQNNIFLVVRTNNKFTEACKNIIYVDSSQRIAEMDYDYIITHSMCVYLPYAEDFKYRVSGIFYECISNNIPVLFNKTDSTVQYTDYVTYDYELIKPEEFKDKVRLFLNNKNLSYYKRTGDLDPKAYWKEILV